MCQFSFTDLIHTFNTIHIIARLVDRHSKETQLNDRHCLKMKLLNTRKIHPEDKVALWSHWLYVVLWRATCNSILSSAFRSFRSLVSSTSAEMSFRTPLNAQRGEGLFFVFDQWGCKVYAYSTGGSQTFDPQLWIHSLTSTASALSRRRPTPLICPQIWHHSTSPSRLRLPRNRGPSLAVSTDGSALWWFCGVSRVESAALIRQSGKHDAKKNNIFFSTNWQTWTWRPAPGNFSRQAGKH